MTNETTKLKWIWADMLSRCRNPKHKQYKNYGGRGISVCERWRVFKNFLDDVSPRPAGLMLDRVDNNVGYRPDNFRWATRKEQNSNRRNVINIQIDGETMTLREACRRNGLRYRPIVKRIQDRNWPLEMALSTPLGTGKHFKRTPTKSEAA